MSSWWAWVEPEPKLESNEADLARRLDELAEKLCRREEINWQELKLRYPRDGETLKDLACAMDMLLKFGAPDEKSG
jgi:hypothetical protein